MSYVDSGDMYASLAKQDSVVARSRRGQLVALRDQAQQKELVEVRALRQAGREDMEFARRRAAERDRVGFQRAQQRAARQRRGRRAKLRDTAFGAAGLFAESVVTVPDGVSNSVPSAPADLCIRALDDMLRGTWATTRDFPLRGLKNVGNTCYLNSVAQVLMHTPAVVEWMSRHNADGCPKEHGGCALCSLFLTYAQVLGGFAEDDKTPKLAERRVEVDQRFAGFQQHDVVEFFEKFLECVRDVEIAAGRCSTWENIQIAERRATHVERLFGFVRETRRRCRVCRGGVRSWFSGEHVLRVEPKTMPGGPMTVAEMYFDSCAPAENDDAMFCPTCHTNTKHDCQSRMLTAPNVLIVQLKRNSPSRPGVDAEVQLDLLGFPPMELVGVLYHNGATFKSGHYTCLCRGPEGRFWAYNDDHPVHAMNKDVAHVKPKEAYMLVYCRRDGSAVWKQHENDDAEVVQIDEDDDRGGGSGNRGGASCSSGVVGSPSNRRRRRKGGAASPRTDASPLMREATTPEQRAKAARLCSETGDADGSADDIEMSPKRVARGGGSGGGGGRVSPSRGAVGVEPAIREGDGIVSSPLPMRRLGRETSASQLESDVASPKHAGMAQRRSHPVTPSRRMSRKTSCTELHDRDAKPAGCATAVDESLAAVSANRRRMRSKSPGRATPTRAVPSAEPAPVSCRSPRQDGVGEGVSRDLHWQAVAPGAANVVEASTHPVAKAKPLARLRRGASARVDVELEGAGLGVIPDGASSASIAAPVSILRRSSRIATRAVGGASVCDRNVEGADTAGVRAVAEARRGIGDMSVADRMARRSQAREDLDLAELRGRGRGRGTR